MVVNQFAQAFREEHRKVRDTLLELIKAFQNRDRGRIQELINQTAVYTGPHFRYEEEALYPALVEIYGQEYIGKLLGDHDTAIGTAKKLVELAGKDPLTDDDVALATRLTRTILPHVSDCEGLSIMVEVLAEEKVHSVLQVRERALAENLNLLEWADKVRERPASVISQ